MATRTPDRPATRRPSSPRGLYGTAPPRAGRSALSAGGLVGTTTADQTPTYDLRHLDDDTIVDWVDVGLLFVDRYARPVSEKQINRMLADGLDTRKFGTIMLSLRDDGRFAILDGRHRTDAARKCGITRMLARVFIDLSYEQEADLFIAFNTVNRPTAMDRFRARLEKGELAAREIRQILQAHGLDVALDGRSVGSVSSVNALDKIYAEQGPIALDRIVDIIYRSWGTARKAWIHNIVDGLRQFWARYQQEVDVDRLIEKLHIFSPEQIIAQAGLAVARSASPGTMVGRTITDNYNHGMRTHRLADWVDHPGKTWERTRKDEAARAERAKAEVPRARRRRTP